jgi:hypothetical protein
MGAELAPEYWRARAEETRTLAEDMRHHETKEALLRIASDYERIAETADDMQKKRKRLA